MRQVANKIKAQIRVDVVTSLLEGKWTYETLLKELKQKYGIDIGYKAFAKMMINDVSNWNLTYAFVICDFFNMSLTDMFELVNV